jgi:hypothetical protein
MLLHNVVDIVHDSSLFFSFFLLLIALFNSVLLGPEVHDPCSDKLTRSVRREGKEEKKGPEFHGSSVCQNAITWTGLHN